MIRYYYKDGVEEMNPSVFIEKHHLVIEPPWTPKPPKYWEATIVAFDEDVFDSRHSVIRQDSSAQVNDPGMHIAWWYPSVHQDRPFLPRGANPAYSFPVLANAVIAETGIPTPSDGAPFRCWIDGTFLGLPIISETVHLGMVDAHAQLDVGWSLRLVGGSIDPPPPPPGPSGSHLTLVDRDVLVGQINALQAKITSIP